MNRRSFLARSLMTLSAPIASALNAADDPGRFLAPTRYIDSAHSSIVAAVATVADKGNQTDRARAIHDFVRDRILFGFASSFYDQAASEVLASGIGYCNTKSTLFIAMLRAAGIPARQHFVDIDARILKPLVDPGTAYVDHSYSEVYLDGRWVRTDSYIIDPPLAIRARTRLIRESKCIGYGVHREGVSIWQGSEDAFSQFIDDSSVDGFSRRDHGVFKDVGAFYDSDLGLNTLNPLLRIGFGLLIGRVNRNIDAFRKSTM
jgi:hypothetical protein